ncbi:MAG: amidohydrolase family protein [Candidatus Atribacteria bacterium]|nr:amidohydrolase family protein [Candidatus Atribacteria bacterium]
MSFYEDLFNQLLTWKKIDTHEHFLPQNTYQDHSDILFAILRESYLPWIIYGARDHNIVTITRDGLLQGMKKIPASAFLRYIIEAFHYMYGFSDDELNEKNWDQLSQRIRESYSKNNMLDHWIFDKLNIEKVVHDRYWKLGEFDIDLSHFYPVLRIDPLFYGYSKVKLNHDRMNPHIEAAKQGIYIETFDEYLSYIDQLFKNGIAKGIGTMKCAVAYDRTLRFERVEREQAERAFYKKDGTELSFEVRDFQDYIFHYCLQKAADYRLPVQIHTGPGKAFETAASHLGNIFEEYHELKISLFHGSFPWVGEPGAMSLFYPNLYLDLVWLPVMSPTYAVLALSEWLETTGGARIMMGGDSWNAEGAVGSILYNLKTIAYVLTEKVEKKYLSRSSAEQIGKMILYDNPKEFLSR